MLRFFAIFMLGVIIGSIATLVAEIWMLMRATKEENKEIKQVMMEMFERTTNTNGDEHNQWKTLNQN